MPKRIVKNSKELVEVMKQDITNLVFDTHRVIIENSFVRTGRTRHSIKVEKTSDGWIIGTNLSYAEYEELGIGLFGPKYHIIRPIKAKALHWINEQGQDVFAMKSRGFEGSHAFLKGMNYFIKNLKKLQAGGKR